MAISHLKSVLDDSSDFGETEGSDIIHDTITLPLVSPQSEIMFTDINTKTSNRVRRMARIFVGFWGILRPLSCRFSGLTPDLFWDFKSGPRWAFYSERRIRSICPVAIRQKNEAGSYHEMFRVPLGFQLPLASRLGGHCNMPVEKLF